MSDGDNKRIAGIQEDFWRLAEVFCEKSKELHDSREREPYLLSILHFVQNHLDDRDIIESCFMQIVREEQWPLEILEFAMHELKWPTVRAEIEDAMKVSRDIREQDALERVLKAFDANWEDADLYRYYAS
jgi:hypothetical protein